LSKTSALAFEKAYILHIKHSRFQSWKDLLREADQAQALKYIDSRITHDDALLVWAFSIVRRENQLLTYKVGRYRDNRDTFANRRSIGFTEMVGFEDASLFSDDMGVTECGLSAVMTDLDLSRSAFGANKAIIQPTISFALIAKETLPDPVFLFVMEWQCPSWFEPTARRLSLNEVRWTDATRPPNDIDAFEPWSAVAFTALVEMKGAGHHYGKENKGATRGVSAF
jgi:hypothetical protein